MRFKEGKKYEGKNKHNNMYMFVEFEDEASVPIVTQKINKGHS